MSAPVKVTFPSFMLQISGELYAPLAGAPDRKGAAVVISHPMTGVKEQTSADHARLLSKAGFYALTFDAGYQGESTGQPRGLEDPHQRAEDNKAAVTYLTTLDGKVDPSRIGVLGICASGGYTSYAARSLTAVSRHLLPQPASGVQAWPKGSHAELPPMFSSDISQIPEDADSFFKDAASYYGSQHGNHPRSDQKVPPASYDLMVSYDSFNFQHLISPRPLLMVAGSEAQTLHYSQNAVAAAREPKELLIVEEKNHFDLYDDLTVSGPKLVEFFGKNLLRPH
ncbi:hypothetical protein PMG11_08833 [Penicillium brasilianum]|uniref:Dienelactone hydrolase domain-containing protein n=1 Tax=Penicillium brasilianum TaxID=104259 RepID=A0A0F7TZ01_PENBI|nr:hypothetical protein PMG11_08833 [Penicillium brasilianum]